jgi:hypothetical protein
VDNLWTNRENQAPRRRFAVLSVVAVRCTERGATMWLMSDFEAALFVTTVALMSIALLAAGL